MFDPSKTTLYFDGQCPLCSREIAKLKKNVLEPISFVDIHEADLSKTDKTLFLKKLHLFRDGEVEVQKLGAVFRHARQRQIRDFFARR